MGVGWLNDPSNSRNTGQQVRNLSSNWHPRPLHYGSQEVTYSYSMENRSEAPEYERAVLLQMDTFVSQPVNSGHSTEKTLEARMNTEADFMATSSQKKSIEIPVAPLPTFAMNDFTLYHSNDGWIESNISQYIDISIMRQSKNKLNSGANNRNGYLGP
ncbi:hypothetical protein CVT26_002489 [Gymnopilus dilepis]|uniref:Uncharacterized protein n=1 Tax=Gymnopilus dilepis TaxID=231916 RepID=A0A409YNE5_9AGAR|nr:hypothetical protein CVT26_002489 [Gymnopilus dilepis]